MDEVMRALAHPQRRRILELVRDRELTAGELAANFDVTRPAVSQHLTVLRAAGLLDERREGTRRWYHARAEGLADVRAFVDGFWADRLDTLKRAVEADRRSLEPHPATSPRRTP